MHTTDTIGIIMGGFFSHGGVTGLSIRIAIDAMGGDFAPASVCQGAIAAASGQSELSLYLYGPKETLEEQLLSCPPSVRKRIQIVHAPDTITMEDAPALAVRRKTESSMVMAAMALREGTADAFVSAGSTGAVLLCGLLRVGRIQGVERPALAVTYPGAQKPFLLLDSGANVDCQPKWLMHFGLMGAAYMRALHAVADPEVRLVNIGAEETKGNKLSQEAYALMRSQNAYRFGGNIEAREVPYGAADVVVCDGFDGNILIKLTEGLASAMFSLMKEDMLSTVAGKIGGLLVKPSLRAFKKRLDSEQYGGAPLLGVNGVMVKAHGNSTPTAIQNAIYQAANMVRGNVVSRIAQGLQENLDPTPATQDNL